LRHEAPRLECPQEVVHAADVHAESGRYLCHTGGARTRRQKIENVHGMLD
jgi:hypothetical protein